MYYITVQNLYLHFFLAGASLCDLHQNFLCSTIIFNTSVELMREREREREREFSWNLLHVEQQFRRIIYTVHSRSADNGCFAF